MNAGRELDALVAERRMGWKAGTLALYREQRAEHGEGETAFDTPAIALPHYSTDIAAAWEVWSLPQHDGWVVQRWNYDGVWHHIVASGADTFERGEFLAQEHSLPLAICLAALKALEAAP